MILLNPGLGLYAFCFSLVLIPYDWRIEGLKFMSLNVLLVGAATLASARQATALVAHDHFGQASRPPPYSLLTILAVQVLSGARQRRVADAKV